MDTYSLIALIFVALILISVLLAFRRHNRKKRQEEIARAIEEGDYQDIELIRLQNPSQKDEQAYELIEGKRQKVLTSFSLKTSLAPRKIWKMSFDLVREIAAIYHPDIEDPQLQASIVDLLDLNERIVKRVKKRVEDFPNMIKNINIQNVVNSKTRFDEFSQSAIIKFPQNHKYLYSIGKKAWWARTLVKGGWGLVGRLTVTATKEAAYRSLLSVIIYEVGKETIFTYSKRHISKEAVALDKNIAFEMINMALVDNIVSSEEYEVILNFILNNSNFDDHIKIILLKALKRRRPVKSDIPVDKYNEKEKKRLLAEVKRVAKADKLDTLKKSEALIALEESLKPNLRHRER